MNLVVRWMPNYLWMLVAAESVFVFAGCDIASKSSVALPNVSPGEAALGAIRLYDADGNGSLSGAELEACPAMSVALKEYDNDGDNQISQEEVAGRIAELFPQSVGLLTVDCVVTHQGRPLSGATVTFTPEKFLGESIQTAVGTTDHNGAVSPSIPSDALPAHLKNEKLMQPGIYRVEVKHSALPADVGKPLGAAIDPSRRDGTTLLFEL
jgi:hypothetical protein